MCMVVVVVVVVCVCVCEGVCVIHAIACYEPILSTVIVVESIYDRTVAAFNKPDKKRKKKRSDVGVHSGCGCGCGCTLFTV